MMTDEKNRKDCQEEFRKRLVIDKTKIIGKKNDRSPLVRRLWVLFHLRLLCDNCPRETSATRDILGEGICWWKKNWQAGNYSIPFWMGKDEKARLQKIADEMKGAGLEPPRLGSIEAVIIYQAKKIIHRLIGPR